MTYKILFVKNRYTKKLKLQKYLDWFSVNTPIAIQTEEISTDFELTTAPTHNATYSGVVVGNDIVDKLRTVVPENKYNAVVLVYGNDLNGIRVSCTNGTDGYHPLYPNTDLIQLVKLNDGGKILNHELFHAFFAKAHRRQINIVDNMDTYYRDNILDTDNGDTNRTIALRTLAPYWNQIISMTPVTTNPIVTITRSKSNKHETLGILTATNAGANFSCQTLELPWLNNAPNISCIPVGVYAVKRTFSPKFLKYTYEVQGVPKRSGIRIHSANYYTDIQGCVALGSGLSDLNKDGELDVTNSRNTIKSFEGFMQNKPFTLIIR